ncbi:uncharacterized protein [Nicotiana tomentosiformis]|uniref:uncharacterized protein n=1 Tax=Nicotiana tomentosiformis TaxID=4098 RepID=UPI00051B5470|nr:uncharacterized protein LOC117279909 [Nicotiana tomentosiformis]
MPTGYKPPKFDIFDGTGDPHAHLRAYYDKLVGVGRNEKLRMKLFIRSLTGEALTWFSLKNLQKKPSELFQEYARRCRSEAARAQPPLDDSELTKYFIKAHEGIYFEKVMCMIGQKFPELVKMGHFLEEGIKSGKVQSMDALQAASKAIQSDSIDS